MLQLVFTYFYPLLITIRGSESKLIPGGFLIFHLPSIFEVHMFILIFWEQTVPVSIFHNFGPL